MAGNTSPIFPAVPNIGFKRIPTTNAQVKSDGVSAGSSADQMYKVFTAGANGSKLDFIRFWSVANAVTTGVATIVRAYLSTVSTPTSGTTDTDTFLIGELSLPAQSSANSTNPVNYYDMNLNLNIPTGYFVHVSQHVAQTTNQGIQAQAFGGDF